MVRAYLRSFVSAAILALAVVALSTTTAQSAPITSIDGSTGFFSMNPITGVLSFAGNGQVQGQNGAPQLPAFPALFSNITFSFSGGKVTFTSGDVKTILPPAQIATFNLTAFTQFSLAANTFIFNGNDTLISNGVAGFDYTPFANPGGRITFTLNATPGIDIANELAAGHIVTGSGSFSQVAATVPEPVSMAVWGMVGIGGLVVARRRLTKKVAF